MQQLSDVEKDLVENFFFKKSIVSESIKKFLFFYLENFQNIQQIDRESPNFTVEVCALSIACDKITILLEKLTSFGESPQTIDKDKTSYQ